MAASEKGGGGKGERAAGETIRNYKGKMEIIFAHVGVRECVESIRGRKKEVHNKQWRREGEGRKGGRIEYADACTRKSLHCSLAAEVIQLARG